MTAKRKIETLKVFPINFNKKLLCKETKLPINETKRLFFYEEKSLSMAKIHLNTIKRKTNNEMRKNVNQHKRIILENLFQFFCVSPQISAIIITVLRNPLTQRRFFLLPQINRMLAEEKDDHIRTG